MSLEIVKKLKPCSFKYNAIIQQINDNKTHMGFIAQDLLELFPENEYAVVFKNGEYYNVNLLQLIAPMVKAIQELSEKVDRLEKIERNN